MEQNYAILNKTLDCWDCQTDRVALDKVSHNLPLKATAMVERLAKRIVSFLKIVTRSRDLDQREKTRIV